MLKLTALTMKEDMTNALHCSDKKGDEDRF